MTFMSLGTPHPWPKLLALLAVLTAALAGISCLGTRLVSEPMDPGISEDQVVFGQSAAFSGPARQLGQDMRLGILAAFDEANRAGGVHGRRLELRSLDDGYEPIAALSNAGKLIHETKVFGLIGTVGTPTTRAAFVAADFTGVPFVAPFTGAEFLRDPEFDNIMNLRASYHQETEEMVARLTQDLGITRIAVFYQNDAYGQSGLAGVRLALERRGMEMVASGHYKRNTEAVHGAAGRIVEAEPEAVIMIGAYAPVAKAVLEVRRHIDPVFMAVSFVGGKALADRLRPAGEGVFVTQVVPFPEDDDLPVAARYRAALEAHDPDATQGFVSLEGYLAGRLAIFGLDACGRDLSRRCFLDALRSAETVNIDGFRLEYGPDDNQGSDAVFMTVIGKDSKYRQVQKFGGEY